MRSLAATACCCAAASAAHGRLDPSVANYVRRLREESAGRGGEDAKAARARLATAQATLNERAKQFAGELVEASEVEAMDGSLPLDQDAGARRCRPDV